MMKWLCLLFATVTLNGGLNHVENLSHGGLKLNVRKQAENVEITVLYDNYPHVSGLETDWGFACLVKGLEKTILFDTGANGSILMSNMKKLDVAPESVDVVVISHAHWDHTGGLRDFLAANHSVTVYASKSLDKESRRIVQSAGAELVEVVEPVEICPGASSTGSLGMMIKEQSLVLETTQGGVVITGCAHPGIVETVRHVVRTMGRPVYMALGGFHLYGKGDGKINGIIQELKQLGVQRSSPCHCSGDRARDLFDEGFGNSYLAIGVGTKICFDPAN